MPFWDKPIYEDKLVQRTECTRKSKQLGQALKKCFNPNTLPRLQVFICWLSFEREKWHYETKAFSTISALFVNLVLCPLGRCALVPSWLWILCCGFRIFGTGYESSWFFSVNRGFRIPILARSGFPKLISGFRPALWKDDFCTQD